MSCSFFCVFFRSLATILVGVVGVVGGGDGDAPFISRLNGTDALLIIFRLTLKSQRSLLSHFLLSHFFGCFLEVCSHSEISVLLAIHVHPCGSNRLFGLVTFESVFSCLFVCASLRFLFCSVLFIILKHFVPLARCVLFATARYTHLSGGPQLNFKVNEY